MKTGSIAALIALGSMLAGCQPSVEESVADEQQNETRLMQGCSEAGRLLGQMSAAETSFRYDSEGNVRISRSLWYSIPASMQDGLIKAIAYHAVCEEGDPAEQVVTVRASENSEILAQQTVTEFDR
ncbi:hypothetical protein [Sphingosinicella sp. CPCC 101087]|uniref:hypothetical protein n=1 Tax=Sphingosinicella sp. CPCC 101087 TaxID=2497754 RepID=UPI00101CE247|nr:hypothetical protein [Sphingosinicella sp. CPCC 101087]